MRITQRAYRRTFYRGKIGQHTAQFVRTTWWIFGFIPVFSKERLISHNM